MSHTRHLRCRCLSGGAGLSSGRSFFLPNSRAHYAPDLPIRLEHVSLEVSIDPKKKTISGWTHQRLRVVAPGQTAIRLDQDGLTIDEVQVGGKAARFEVSQGKLRILLGTAPAPGEELELAVRYHVTNPRRGLYFIGPDADYPDKLFQAWTQGQDEYSHFWFPVADYPNQKATSEVIVTVPKKFTAVSNGALLSQTEVEGGTRFHYKLGMAHVVYLITIAVGEFAQWQDAGPRGLPVQYFVPPGREEDGKRSFGNTPKMIEAFEKKTGVPYPVREIQPGRRPGFHLRRNGKHLGDDADGPHAPRRARASGFFERPSGLARARAPVVRRSRDLPGLVARLAERGLRDVHGARLDRERPRPGRRLGRGEVLLSTRISRSIWTRIAAGTAGRSSAIITSRRSISSMRTSTTRAASS